MYLLKAQVGELLLNFSGGIASVTNTYDESDCVFDGSLGDFSATSTLNLSSYSLQPSLGTLPLFEQSKLQHFFFRWCKLCMETYNSEIFEELLRASDFDILSADDSLTLKST